ncbi:cuticle protein 70, isoforms A and B [Helicoverpa armigera]|uniref:cuticle protein 70, isoforms A and B-like n=1 Tax=Helicoverpa zea TaxID=7113 RepID=UPI000B39BA21|nr:cuticle protein 70, isoforms A and B [Helicoverpa armigera]XP_047027241.1 cuticle protein 70, isoforms A and B-like [Helicoverpa zea]PZC84250.1 hypothetical protein B5X24_HaOG205445 [Helicoverpa armigera]
MYKLVIFSALLAVAAAAPGYIGGYAAPIAAAPIAAGWGHGVVSAPIYSAPAIVKTAVPVATSYANTVKLASPALVAAHAPIVAAHAPLVAAPAYAHGW